MPRLRRPIAIVWVAALLLAGCGDGAGQPAARVAVGAPAPAYAAPDLQGDTLALEALRGQVVLLNLWATWCEPCREEMPQLEALHRDLGGRGLRVVGVSIDGAGEAAGIRRFLDDSGITFTILHDPDGEVTNRFRTIGVPETFLIGRDGVLRQRWIGRIPEADTAVAAATRAALAEEG